jgi:hypothetical protein
MYNPKGCCELQPLGRKAPNDVPDELFINVQLPDILFNKRFSV